MNNCVFSRIVTLQSEGLQCVKSEITARLCLQLLLLILLNSIYIFCDVTKLLQTARHMKLVMCELGWFCPMQLSLCGTWAILCQCSSSPPAVPHAASFTWAQWLLWLIFLNYSSFLQESWEFTLDKRSSQAKKKKKKKKGCRENDPWLNILLPHL